MEPLGRRLGSCDAPFHEQFSYLEVRPGDPHDRHRSRSARTAHPGGGCGRRRLLGRGRGARPDTVRGLPLGARQRAQNRRRSVRTRPQRCETHSGGGEGCGAYAPYPAAAGRARRRGAGSRPVRGDTGAGGPAADRGLPQTALQLLPPVLAAAARGIPGSSHRYGSSASSGAARRARWPTGGRISPSPPWTEHSCQRGWWRADSSKRATPWCTRPDTRLRARCRWSTGSRTAARTPAPGGARRTGSRGPRSRPRTTEQCSRS
jgi:hypothetical protein